MESFHRERCEDASTRLGVPIFQKHLPTSQALALPDLCSSSSFCKISDETLPYISGIFDETVEPSFISDGPGNNVDHPDRSQLRTLTKSQAAVISGLSSQTKAAYSSWLSAPVENGHSIDLSMSVTSPQNDQKEVTNNTETSPKGGMHDACIGSHLPESTSCLGKGDLKLESKNSTFDMTVDLKDKSSTLNSTISLSVRAESNNITFEKTQELKETSAPGLGPSVGVNNASLETVHEKHLNSTVENFASNTTTEQLNEKLYRTVDLSQSLSDVPKQEPRNEGPAFGEDCEKHGTFTKIPEEASGDLTVDGEQNGSASVNVSAEAGEPSAANPKPADGTFVKHNATTDLTSAEPPTNFKNADVNTTMNMTKPPDSQLPAQSEAGGGAAVDDAPPSGPISSVPVMQSSKMVVCSNRTLDIPDAEIKAEEHQELFRRRNGVSEQEFCLNLDVSHSSMFSLDDTLEMQSRALVTSTPIVLGRGFDRLGCAKLMDVQKRLSVINSIDAQSKDDLVGISEHDGSDPSDSNPVCKSETCSQMKVSTKCTSNSSTSESAVANKPPSKLAVRRKIPQPSCKSNIPKTQILPRPPTSQATSMVAKPNTVSTTQVPDQPEASSSALRSMKRTVQLSKGKNVAPAKNMLTAGTVRTSVATTSSSGCTLTTVSKPVTQAKPSGLQPPGRGRLVFKAPAALVCSAESGHPQPINKPTGLPGIRTRSSLLPGFAQKHASSDALPLAKRKRTDMQHHPSCAEAPASLKPGRGAQKPVMVPVDSKPKKPNTECESCSLLQEKLNTFHQELGEFLQELGRISASCENWLPFQQKFEACLEEFKRLQAEHQ
ncbi:uncharacterized protein si:ch211-126c2.4 isoform X2 [Pygocentrus nattereri]|uniref:Uncharacterized protein n=1 Tax=Pygocentrus nattereri TaxID=42514 RepID=A0AAR2JQZ4_PYGNA|nr:uncharacterized protein si:ch211-126c2.4 isoform X2 [Pygocentrus nattereri]